MQTELIATVYIPIRSILVYNENWKKSLGLPSLSVSDIKIIKELKKDTSVSQIIVDQNLCAKKVKSLSFFDYLLNKFLDDAKLYAFFGIRNFLISDDPIDFEETDQVVYWIMRVIAFELRKICSNKFNVGLRIHKEDKWAIDIACRNYLDFIIIKDYKNYSDISLSRNLCKNSNNLRIYTYYNEFKNIPINAQGIVIKDNRENYLKDDALLDVHHEINKIVQKPFYPRGMKFHLLVDYELYDKEISFYKDNVDYIITNTYFNKDNFWCMEIDHLKLKHVMDNYLN